MEKSETWYVVKLPCGSLLPESAHHMKRETLDWLVADHRFLHTQEQLRKQGYRCVKVEIRELPNA